MNPRWLTFRILAPVLALTWTVLGAWMVVLHARVEGAGPVVAAWPFLPAAIAAFAVFAAFRLRREEVPGVARLLIGLTALLLAVSFAITLVEPSGMPDRALYGASPMIALGGGLAVAVTTLFALTGWRPGQGVGGVVAFSLVAGVAAGAGLMLPAAGIAAATCDTAPQQGTGRSETVVEGWVDSERLAYDVISGAPGAGSADASTAAVVDLLADVTDPAVEDRGIDVLGGTPLRHCRRLVSGSQALRGFEHLGLAIRPAPDDPATVLGVWRGELDWWSNERGELVAVRVSVGGLASDLWPGHGVRGLLRAELRVPAGSTARHLDEPLP